MNETQKIIAQQINAKELNFARFKLMIDGDNTVIIKKGKKFLKIEYDHGSDLYNIYKGVIKGFNFTEEKTEGIYCEQLQSEIAGYFPNFEYVMDGLMAK